MQVEEFKPLIVAFCCNWCSYAGADLAGNNRLNYPADVKISGEGTSEIVIQGIQKHELHGTCFTTIPDRIEAGTYISAIIASRGSGIIRNIFPSHLTIYTGKLLEMGAKIKLIDPNTLQVSADRRLDAQNFITQPYPGFPTDLQACAMMLLAISNGVSVMTEGLFENRFTLR